jgi:hypothetical protein
MLDNRTLATRTASLNLQSSACWRTERAESYPNDAARNLKAAQMLRDLNSQLHFSDDDWVLLEPYFNGADQKWIRALTETNRLIGFKNFPQNSSDYVAYLFQTLVNGGEQSGGAN